MMKKSKFLVLIFCCLALFSAEAQQSISGVVVSSKEGAPLLGVSVSDDNGTKSTQTNEDGQFSIEVGNEVAYLVFNRVGYEHLRVPINGRNTIHVTLQESLLDIEEVVVVGYGTQRKLDVTGSISTVSGQDLAKRPVISTSMGLQGMVPGLTVTQSSGRPGADGGTLRVRGIGTLNDSNPLVLIDGREGSLETLDGNEIESVSVLKDASAAAIYGSRAANGVILVTTKRGKRGGMSLSYNGYIGKEEFTEMFEYVNGFDHMVLNNIALENAGLSKVFTDDYIDRYIENNSRYSYDYPNVDWQELIYSGKGRQEHHNLMFSGGTDRLSSMASLSFRNQGGLIPKYNAKRIGLRLNNDYKVSEKFDFSVDLSARVAPISFPAGGANQVFDLIRYSPLFAAYLPDGRYSNNAYGYPNLKAMIEEGGSNTTNYSGLSGRFLANFKPIDGLKLTVSYMPEYGQSRSTSFSKPVPVYEPNNDEPVSYNPTKSHLTEAFSKNMTHNLNALASYGYHINNHHVNVLAGYEQISFYTDNFNAYRENFTFLEYPVLNTGSQVNMSNGGTGSEWALQSYFGRVGYNYANRYLLEFNARYDGSSRFVKRNRFGFFPSISAGWNIGEEEFIKQYDFIDLLKIRGSYGVLGNQNIGTYPSTSIISLNQNYVFDGIPISGGALTEMANEHISWESLRTYNIGLDVGLYNKLSATFEYYVRDTYDILLKLPINKTIGLVAPYQNAGKVQNKGWDFSLSYKDFDRPFGYGVRAILSDVKNKVVDLKDTGPYISTFSIIKEGEPINALFMYKSDGLFRTEEDITNHVKQIGDLKPGDIRYVNQKTVDTDGDGVFDEYDDLINANDRVVVGNNIPRYNFSLDFDFKYKAFDMSVYLQGVGKRDAYYGGNLTWAFYNRNQIQTWQLDFWSPDNPDGSYPRIIDGSAHNNFQVSDFWMYNASYLRIKTFQLGYTLPSKLTAPLKINKIRFYASGNNLYTFDKLPKGFDPEYPIGTDTHYPITRNYVFGLNVNF